MIGLGAAAKVSVLFARRDSIYKELGCDVWDADRDARNFKGNNPVICHPPCRAWGRLKHLATRAQLPEEYQYPMFCLSLILRNGGVLEHPATSLIWKTIEPTIVVDQYWFGHKAQKRTGLFINGNVPPVPLRLVTPPYEHVVGSQVRKAQRRDVYHKRLTDAEREHTPRAFAEWLIEAASKLVPVDEVREDDILGRCRS